jgi:hypothetical protein
MDEVQHLRNFINSLFASRLKRSPSTIISDVSSTHTLPVAPSSISMAQQECGEKLALMVWVAGMPEPQLKTWIFH